MPDTAEQTQDTGAVAWSPEQVRVLNLPATKRARLLQALERYGVGTQWDHLSIDWRGSRREPWTPHAVARLEKIGVWEMRNAAQQGDRRPNSPVPLAGLIVEGFSDMLLGEGREATVAVPGDEDTEALLDVVLKMAEAWDALLEARDNMGRCGSAAIVPALVDGVPVIQVLNTAELEVERWARGTWVPEIVVEQRLVNAPVLDPKDNVVKPTPVWRVRAWDGTNEYSYKDLPLDATPKTTEETQAQWENRHFRVGAKLELETTTQHHAGRCPVVWLQNTRDSKNPDSCPDYDQQATELMDRADVLQSMIVRGGIANVDPTLVVSDYVWAQRYWPHREKGYGKIIQLSEAGKAQLMEIAGAAVESSRKILRELILQIEHRCGIVIIDPDTAGAYRSGEALSLLWNRMTQKAGRKRKSLTRGLRQLCAIMLEIVASVGVDRLRLPPRTMPTKTGELEPVDHKLGDGRWLSISWPPYLYPTASEFQQYTAALAAAVGNKQLLSAETGTAELMAKLGRQDPQAERRRIEQEHERRVAELDATMDDLDEPGLDDKQPDEQPAAAARPSIGDTDLNGAQLKALSELVALAGVSLAPEAVIVLITNAFPSFDETAARSMIERQVQFTKTNPGAVGAETPARSPALAARRAEELAADTGDEGEDQDEAEARAERERRR